MAQQSALGALALLAAFASCPASRAPVSPATAARNISPDEVFESVKTLAADDMEGRGLGTHGNEMAGQYIADHFTAAGLAPAGDEGTWFQSFDMTVGADLGENNHLVTKIPEAALTGFPTKPVTDTSPQATITWSVGTAWTPVGFSESGDLKDRDVVFAGYGITAPQYDYDDYANLDVTDKLVLVFRFEPGENDPNSPFDGRDYSQYAALRYKTINAREHGAAGVIIVTPILGHEQDPDDLVGLDLGFAANSGVIAIHVRREIAQRLMAGAGIDLKDVQKAMEETGKNKSAPLGVKVSLQVDVKTRKAPARNVVGMLEGSDPKLAGEAVVIGAHYDGLGFGSEGTSLDPDKLGQVHNGADDNASGTAALMAIAAAFGHSKPPPRRTTIFIAFSAEESGLGGSTYYSKHPHIPMDHTVAMFNMDMVGRMKEKKVHAFGSETASEWPDLLVHANTENLVIDAHGDGYGPSDHTAFYAKKVPVLHFFTGAHAQYHKTTDDVEYINPDGLASVARLVARAAREVADTPARPTYQKPKTSPHSAVAAGEGHGYGRAWFGSIPDFTEREEPGVALTGVREGSPAAKAGVQAGDVIVKFGDVDVKNLYDFTFALRKRKPGDAVDVILLRDGKKMTVQVTLGKRGG